MSRDVAMEQLHALMRDLKSDREVESREDSHQWQREAIPGTAGGRARSASPVAEPGTGTPAVNLQRGGPAGEIIHLSATADSIASGGDYLTATAAQHQHGFADTTTGTDVTIPRTGNYDISLAAKWDSFLRGGKVEWELNGTVLPWSLDAGGLGDGVTWADTFYAEKGDTLKVKVTQTSGSAQALTWDLTVSVQEPRRAIATPQWTKVADVDAWGIFNDGTHWWVTEGAGHTVSKYDSDWVLQSSFEASVYGSDFVRGITMLGGNIWLGGASAASTDVVAEYNTSGTLQSTFDSLEGTLTGVTTDGTDLWICDGATDNVRRFNTAGTLQETITVSGGREGLAYHGGNLVFANADADTIEVRNTAGVLQQTIGATGPINGPTGVWVAADGTLYASKDGDGVYKWNEGTL